MKLRFLPILLTVVLLVPWVVAAQTTPANPCTGGAAGNFGQCISQIYIWSLGLSALLAVVMIVYGGYTVMTARGNAQQAENGKSYILSSLIGMVLLMAAYLILNTINPDLVNFDIPGMEDYIMESKSPKTNP